MSSKKAERARLSRTYNHLYTPHSFEGQNVRECFYCADPAETRDHCPPLSWVETRKQEAWRDAGVAFVTVPCCAPCNGLLGRKGLFTLKERADYLEQRLSAKFDRESTLWSEDEIDEMGPSFQKTIRARQKAVDDLARRVQNAQARSINYHSLI